MADKKSPLSKLSREEALEVLKDFTPEEIDQLPDDVAVELTQILKPVENSTHRAPAVADYMLPKTSLPEAIARRFTKAGTLGFADEIGAGASAAVQSGKEFLGLAPDDGRSFSEDFALKQDIIQANDRRAELTQPLATVLTELGVSGGMGGGATKAVAGKLAKGGMSAAKAVAKGNVIVGASEGGLRGLGEGDTAGERAFGTVVGGTLGAGGAAIGNKVGGLINRIGTAKPQTAQEIAEANYLKARKAMGKFFGKLGLKNLNEVDDEALRAFAKARDIDPDTLKGLNSKNFVEDAEILLNEGVFLDEAAPLPVIGARIKTVEANQDAIKQRILEGIAADENYAAYNEKELVDFLISNSKAKRDIVTSAIVKDRHLSRLFDDNEILTIKEVVDIQEALNARSKLTTQGTVAPDAPEIQELVTNTKKFIDTVVEENIERLNPTAVPEWQLAKRKIAAAMNINKIVEAGTKKLDLPTEADPIRYMTRWGRMREVFDKILPETRVGAQDVQELQSKMYAPTEEIPRSVSKFRIWWNQQGPKYAGSRGATTGTGVGIAALINDFFLKPQEEQEALFPEILRMAEELGVPVEPPSTGLRSQVDDKLTNPADIHAYSKRLDKEIKDPIKRAKMKTHLHSTGGIKPPPAPLKNRQNLQDDDTQKKKTNQRPY